MFNSNNRLNLKTGSKLLWIELSSKEQIAIPSKLATKTHPWTIKVVNVYPDGAFTAHWYSNWNLEGDFRSELMLFNNNLELDKMDLKKRNAFRRKHNLIEIEE